MRLNLKVLIICSLVIVTSIGWNNVLARIRINYLTSIHMYNLSEKEASFSAVAHNESGVTQILADLGTIAAGGTYSYLEGTQPVSPGFSGALTFVVDQQFESIVNIRSEYTDFYSNTKYAYASYTPPQSGSTTVSLPLLFKQHAGYSTWYRVQNLGSGPATINVSYSDGTVLDPITIPTGGVKTFNQDAEAHSDSVFAGTITSNEAISAVVIEESAEIMFAYTGFGHGTTEPAFPLMHQNNSGYRTGIQIQNIGTQATTVTLEYTPVRVRNENGTYREPSGTQCTETIPIAAGASATFALRIFQGRASPGQNGGCIQERFVGSAKVTTNLTNQPLIGIANQILPGIKGEAYGSFDIAQATHKIALPLIMDRYQGFSTGISIQHVAGVPSAVACIFNNTEYTVTFPAEHFNVTSSFTSGQRNKIGLNYIGSGICEAANPDTKILGIVNQVKGHGDNPQDLFLVYEGISVR